MKRFLAIFVVFLSLSTFGQKNEIDSLKYLVSQHKTDDTLRIVNCIKIANKYNELLISDSAEKYYTEALSMSERIDNYYFRVINNHELSELCYNRGDYSRAFYFIEKIFNLVDSTDVKTNDRYENSILFASIIKVGEINMNSGNFQKANQNFFSALKLAETVNDTISVIKALGSISHLLIKTDEFDKSIEYLNKAEALLDHTNNISLKIKIINTFGVIYFYKNDFTQSKKYYQKSLDLALKINDRLNISVQYGNIAEIESLEKNYSYALELYAKALEIQKSIGYKIGMIFIYYGTANTYIQLSNYEKAMEDYLHALQIAEETNNNVEKYTINKLISELYEKKGDFPNALSFHKKYVSLKDSIFIVNKMQQIYELETQYQTVKKEQQLAFQKTELKKNKAQKNQMLIGLLASVIIIILIVVGLLNTIKNKRLISEINNKLVEQKNEILSKNNMLENQKAEIMAQTEKLEIYAAEMEQLSIVASETDNVVIILNADEKIIWINDAYERLYNYPKEKILHKKLREASSYKDINRIIEDCREFKKSIIYESEVLNPENEAIFVQTTLTPILDSYGEIEKFVIIDTDIRKLKEAEQIIKEKNYMITGSIQSAQAIQKAILPFGDTISRYFNHYIMYKPKDIVSGDFYWYSMLPAEANISTIEHKETDLSDEHNFYHFFAVADCTGHGVPGAFMSMIGSRLISEIINEKKMFNPELILEMVDERINTVLQQQKTSNSEGMDCAILRLQTCNDGIHLKFAGAQISTYCLLKDEAEPLVLKADRRTLGGYRRSASPFPFENKDVVLKQGSVLYVTTDGLIDQNNFHRKRFGTPNFVKLLAELKTLPILEQKMKIENVLEVWKQNEEQRDDITVLCIEV